MQLHAGPPDILDRVRQIEAVCAAYNVEPVAAALQLVLGHPAVENVVAGAVGKAELSANATMLGTVIPAGLWSDFKSEGLIRQDAPVPVD